jgi:hypothetical protein
MHRSVISFRYPWSLTVTKRTASTKSAPARKTTRTAAPKSNNVKKRKAGREEVTLERREKERRETKTATAVAPPLERRQKVNRRRQIDPTTCERDYTDAEVEFMNALEVYKRKNGRMFPTCSEVLEVIRGLGYVKPGPVPNPPVSELQSNGVLEHEFGFANRSERYAADFDTVS